MLLAAYGQLWDAEVVLRSVFEGTVKFAFLLQGEQDFTQRHQEYAEDLFQIALLKDDQKARDLLDVVKGSDARAWMPLRDRLLPDADKESIRRRYSRVARASLEKRWGFTAMLRALNGSGDPAFAQFAGLAHGYAIASHIQHADYVGASIPMDRDRRSANRRDAIHLAHLARLISDTLACLLMRLAAGYLYIGHDPSPVSEATAKLVALQDSFGGAYERWLDVEYGMDEGSAGGHEAEPEEPIP